MFGLGFYQYVPYGVYVFSFMIALLALFYRNEIGIFFVAFFLPIYAVLFRVIHLELPFSKDIIDMIVIAMLLGWLFQGHKTAEKEMIASPLLKTILIFMGYTFFSFLVGSLNLESGIFSDVNSQRLAVWKNYMIMPILYLITYYNLKDRRWQYAFFIMLFFSFLAMSYKFKTTFRWYEHTHYMDESRLGGTFAFLGPNEWGSFQAIYTLFIIGLFLVDKNFWRRIAYLILIYSCTYSLMYSFSRGAYFGFLVGLLFIGFIRSKKLLIPLVIFLLIWKSILPLSVVERIEGTFLEEAEGTEVVSIGETHVSTAGRSHLWDKAVDIFSENPIVGKGFNTYQRLTEWDTHSTYLKTLAEQGIIGFILYLGLYLFALRSGWRLYRNGDEDLSKALGFAFLCAVVGSIVVNIFGDRWTYLQSGGLYWIFWALVDQENSRIKMEKGEMTASLEERSA
jgi:O-antigen ligase